MVRYRRNRVAGGTYFFTVTLRDRRSTALVDHIGLLRAAIRYTRRKRMFVIEAMVVLPDHLHAIWTLPPGDDDYSARWRVFKSRFTQLMVNDGIDIEKNAKGEYNLWQRRYWEHTILDKADLNRHVDYIHYNPVRHGYAPSPAGWPYSSFHRYVRAGLLPPDWGSTNIEFNGIGNE